jgi:uncharacterized integral membrane protein
LNNLDDETIQAVSISKKLAPIFGGIMQPKKIILGIIILLVLIILLQNSQVVILRILFWTIGMSQIVFIPLILFIGFIMGYFVKVVRMKKKLKY